MRASVAELLASFPQSPTPRRGNPAAIARYRSLLHDCVVDGRLTFEEATSLTKQARLTQLTGTQLRRLHEDAWATAFHEEAESEWWDLTPVRRRELYLLADGLGLSEPAAKIQAVIDSCAEPAPPPESRYSGAPVSALSATLPSSPNYEPAPRRTVRKSRCGLPIRSSGSPR
jgi:DNA polymerase III subunit epsilon